MIYIEWYFRHTYDWAENNRLNQKYLTVRRSWLTGRYYRGIRVVQYNVKYFVIILVKYQYGSASEAALRRLLQGPQVTYDLEMTNLKGICRFLRSPLPDSAKRWI